MTLPRLSQVALVNPPSPRFDALDDEEELSFVPLECVWPRAFDASQRRTKSAVSTGYTRFETGDILVPKITPTFQADRSVIAHGLARDVGAGTTELHVVRTTGADPSYVRYLFSTHQFLDGGEAEMIGVAGQKRVPEGWLRNLRVPVADRSEQERIAAFLDDETGRIDRLIATKTRMIELASEHFRSAVSERVDQGQTVAVRRLISLRTSGPRGWGDRVGDSGSPFIRSQNLRRDGIELELSNVARVEDQSTAEAERSRTAEGDVLIGITGANTGWVGLVRAAAAGGFVSQHVAVLRPAHVEPGWLALCLFSHQSQEQLLGGQYGGTKTQLGLDDLAELRIRVPSAEVQMEAVESLELTRRRARGLERFLRTQVELLQERRRSLITAAVTGQMEVP